MTVYLLSFWIGSGTTPKDAYRWRAAGDHALPFEDVTSQPSGRDLTRLIPNLVVLKTDCTQSQLAALRADPFAQVLSSDDDHEGQQTPAEWMQVRAFLLAHGTRPQDLDSAVGPAAGQARRKVVDSLREWLKRRPAGG